MSYYHEQTGKEGLIREIHALADQHNQKIDISAPWSSTYEELLDLKHEVLEELYHDQQIHGPGEIDARKILGED